ncbi:MAG TPA: hypothetical protein VGI12_10835 [Vicinamibacterales bacterium]|jgi:hypothetical protein
MWKVTPWQAVVAAVLMTASPVWAQNSGGAHQDIKVHGHWVIEIRNPDGSLESRHEFNNALTSRGPGILSLILGKATVQFWDIQISGSPAPCVDSVAAVVPCFIEEPNSGNPENSQSSLSLQTYVPIDAASQEPAGTLQLTGHVLVTNPAATSINFVSTRATLRRPDNTTYFASFTSHTLPQVTVKLNQTINVVVTFSFSS